MKERPFEAGRKWGSLGFVLGPLLFLMYVNDSPKGTDSYLNVFPDDAKVIMKYGLLVKRKCGHDPQNKKKKLKKEIYSSGDKNN